jgi:hypothetical protein
MAPEYLPLSRRAFLTRAAVTAGAVAIGGPTLLARPARGTTQINGVHLAYGGDPTSEMGVSWSTPAMARTVIDYGIDDTYGLTVEAADKITATPGFPTVYHHAPLRGLAPNTEYRYRIRPVGESASGIVGQFTTAPAVVRPFRFAMFGDMGVSAGALENLAQLATAAPELCFVVGDLCYADLSGGLEPLRVLDYKPEIWDSWFTQIQPSASRVPWMSTVGNHEMERDGGELGYDNYLARFQLPGNGAVNKSVTYHFSFGNVAFVAADGNDASFEITQNRGYLGAAQDQWLDRTLSHYRRDPAIDFIVVGFHNCMFCTNAFHGSDGGNRSRWQALFDKYEVDVVVNGHNHSYERTHPMRAGAPVVEALKGATDVDAASGTTYITAGGAGQTEYPTHTAPVGFVVTEGGARVPEPAQWSAVTHPGHSIAVVDVTPRDAEGNATMTITGVAKDGTKVDEVTLFRKQPSAA